jgi:2-oxoglutarate ferredoxin oxidoreductase subunit alpha
MSRKFMKGCEAIAEAAVRAGCRFFAGYPITPQNEVPEYFARRMPEVGGAFVQGESEVASINMVYGAASTGTRSMTSSSSPGVALKSEGISYCASARIPMVYANVSRGGPGVGSIQPAQMDYLQATKASGNGGFQMMVFAPASVQEVVDLTYAAFDYADRDRNPVCLLIDGVIGTMMEPIELPDFKSDEEVAAMKEAKKSWACVGHKLDYPNRSWIEPGHWKTSDLQKANEDAALLYKSWEKDVQVEEYLTDDAEIVIAAYGISARTSKTAIDILRKEGIKVGMIRPITVNPFPHKSFENLDYSRVKAILDVEMSIPAQFIHDVKVGVNNRCPIETCLCSGGNLMKRSAIIESVKRINAELGGK